MRLKIIKIVSLVVILFIIVLSVYLGSSKGLRITDATTARGVSEKLKPVGITNMFPAGTSTVFCWFEWQNAASNTSIMASWQYVTDDIRILDYAFDIPRKNGAGSVSLAMPAGKELPPGLYRIDLKKDKRKLRSLTFRVLEKS